MGIRDIRVSVLEKAERLIKQVFSQLCMEYEKQGYAELYEISDEDMEEICGSNGYYFLENGEFFNEDCIEEPEELSAYFDNNGDQCIDLNRDDDGTPVEEIGRYEVTMVYQLQRPSIEMIIDYCRDLLADEKLEVYEFGQNCDLVLHIYKDGEYSPSADKDIFNMVRVHTARDGEWVDDADDIDLNTRRFLRQELERINEYRNFGIL